MLRKQRKIYNFIRQCINVFRYYSILGTNNFPLFRQSNLLTILLIAFCPIVSSQLFFSDPEHAFVHPARKVFFIFTQHKYQKYRIFRFFSIFDSTKKKNTAENKRSFHFAKGEIFSCKTGRNRKKQKKKTRIVFSAWMLVLFTQRQFSRYVFMHLLHDDCR